MRRELVVTSLNRLEAFSRFTSGHDDKHRVKSGLDERFIRRPGKASADVGVSDDGAALAEFEPRTFFAETRQQSRSDEDGIRAFAKWNFHRAHGHSIRFGGCVSKLENKNPALLRGEIGCGASPALCGIMSLTSGSIRLVFETQFRLSVV